MRIANKSLGQNFLVDKKKIAGIINLLPKDEKTTVFEVGPGKGALTNGLIEKYSQVLALEIDHELVVYLNEKIDNSKFTLIEGDILKFNLTEIKQSNLIFVSNLPYYISTKIIFKIAMDTRFKYLGVMMQKELVNRIFASPKTKQYGRLSVSINSLFEIIDKISVPSGCFVPKPKVESVFILLKRKENPINIDDYLLYIKACFANKRKKLLNSLKNSSSPYYELTKEYLSLNNYNPNIRAEEISINEYKMMWTYLNKNL